MASQSCLVLGEQLTAQNDPLVRKLHSSDNLLPHAHTRDNLRTLNDILGLSGKGSFVKSAINNEENYDNSIFGGHSALIGNASRVEEIEKALETKRAKELKFEDVFESNDDNIFAFTGKDFICIANDSRLTSKQKHMIYGDAESKIRLYGNNDVAVVGSSFYGDNDYIDRFIKCYNERFFFEHNRYMDVDNFRSLLSAYAFQRSQQLFLYNESIVAGFKTKKINGEMVKVPTINGVSFGGSFETEFSVALGSGKSYTISCLDSFIGNPIHASASRPLLEEEDAVKIATSILQAVSAKQVMSGGFGQIHILRPEGITRQETISLKSD